MGAQQKHLSNLFEIKSVKSIVEQNYMFIQLLVR
jgi:hypothetical protein